MTTSESKGRFFLQNQSIRLTNRIDWNRELECSTVHKLSVRSILSNFTRLNVYTVVKRVCTHLPNMRAGRPQAEVTVNR